MIITESCPTCGQRIDHQEPGRVELQRTGNAPLVFKGTLIATANSNIVAAREPARWHLFDLFRAEGSRQLVLAIQYNTKWDGELPRDSAFVCEDEAAVIKTLLEYDPAADVQGFPPGDQFKERQRRLLEDIRRRYQTAVADFLRAIGVKDELGLCDCPASAIADVVQYLTMSMIETVVEHQHDPEVDGHAFRVRRDGRVAHALTISTSFLEDNAEKQGMLSRLVRRETSDLLRAAKKTPLFINDDGDVLEKESGRMIRPTCVACGEATQHFSPVDAGNRWEVECVSGCKYTTSITAWRVFRSDAGEAARLMAAVKDAGTLCTVVATMDGSMVNIDLKPRFREGSALTDELQAPSPRRR